MATEKQTWPDVIKNNFLIIIVAIVFFTWWTGCGKGKTDPPRVTSDTTITQVPQPIIIMPPYQPQQQGSTVFPINIPAQYNPSQDLAKLTEQYNDLVKQFLAVKTYKDSIQLKDTAGNRVGVVDLTQVVSENALKSTQPTYQLSFPKTVITNTVYPKPKSQVYVGITTQSLLDVPKVQQASLDVLFKNKKDNIIGLSGYYDLSLHKPGIRLGYYTKIRL